MDIAKKHVVIDLETLSTRNNAVIVSIGAVKIDNFEIVDTFYTNVDARVGKEIGLHIDMATVQWWSEQSKEAQEAWQKEPKHPHEAVRKFREWYGNDSMYTWGYGANFDIVILESTFAALDIKSHAFPWKFWDICCLRTLMNVTDKRLPKANNHNALDDAMAEAKVLIEILKS